MLRSITQALLISFEVVALLLLPSVLGGLLFNCASEVVTDVMLVALAGTAMLTSIATQDGWYLEHLSMWGLVRERVEPGPSPEKDLGKKWWTSGRGTTRQRPSGLRRMPHPFRLRPVDKIAALELEVHIRTVGTSARYNMPTKDRYPFA